MAGFYWLPVGAPLTSAVYKSWCSISLVPRPSHPSVGPLQYYCGGGLVKLITYNDIPGLGWTCGGVAHSQKNLK